tara:strand:+ start:2196 stop:2951 length:756 start_codon:yes stop_codon:yes gene_type:complete
MHYSITQWSVSQTEEHKQDYLESKLDSDICLLSRCRSNHLDMVRQKYEHVWHWPYGYSRYYDVDWDGNPEPNSKIFSKNKSYGQYHLVCATKFKPDSVDFLDAELPSYEYSQCEEGSGAITMTIGDLQTINFATVWGQEILAVQDLKYFFNNVAVKDKCLVAGDLHWEPSLPQSFHTIIDRYEFDASHTDDLITFSKHKPADEENPNGWVQGYRHDRIITKGLNVNDLRSCNKPISEGQAHWIVQYSIDSI